MNNTGTLRVIPETAGFPSTIYLVCRWIEYSGYYPIMSYSDKSRADALVEKLTEMKANKVRDAYWDEYLSADSFEVLEIENLA